MATITTYDDMWGVKVPLDKSSNGGDNLLTLTFYIAKQGGQPEKYDCNLVDIELRDKPKFEGREYFFKPTFQVSEEGFTADKDDNTWTRDKIIIDSADDEDPYHEIYPVIFTDLVLKVKGGAEAKGGQKFMAKAVVGQEHGFTLTSQNWED